jgi:ATP/maltotriose-dependent transcriptional regulator MalT
MSGMLPSPTLPDFALAKIQPPRQRIGLIERPALEFALGEALLQQRLVLLIAAAGYGKTAALTRQIRKRSNPTTCHGGWRRPRCRSWRRPTVVCAPRPSNW